MSYLKGLKYPLILGRIFHRKSGTMTVNTNIPSFTLSSGSTIPAIGFGTGTKWKAPETKKDETKFIDTLVNAIKLGHTHIDAAQMYRTEHLVGEAIKQSGVDRKSLFVTSKVFSHTNIPEVFNKTLTELGLDYVDLYLIHSPHVYEGDYSKLLDSWKVLEGFYKEGKAKSIGVSNFKVDDLKYLLEHAEIPPTVNQIEHNAFLLNQTPGITKFSQANNVLIEAYSPLVPVRDQTESSLHPLLESLSKKYSKSTSQILLRWVYQNNILPITTSENPDRQKESLEIFDFELTPQEVSEITAAGASTPPVRKLVLPGYDKHDAQGHHV